MAERKKAAFKVLELTESRVQIHFPASDNLYEVENSVDGYLEVLKKENVVKID